MGWLGRVLTGKTACCFCGERDSLDALEVYKYCRYYSHTKRHFHETCLRQVLDNPERHSSNDIDTALAIAEQRKRQEESLRAEEAKRLRRLAKLGLLECPYCNRPVQENRETCDNCGAPYSLWR